MDTLISIGKFFLGGVIVMGALYVLMVVLNAYVFIQSKRAEQRRDFDPRDRA